MALSKIDADGVSGLQTALTATTTVPSEGGAVTTSLVQGLEKVWVNFNGTGTVAIRDSLNTSSITDVATGRYRPNYTNSFNYSEEYVFHVTSGVLPATWGIQQIYTHTASSTEFILYSPAGTAYDNSVVPCSVRGDLA
jgi:hypothetical protein